jgi:hypothetical protein
MGADAKDASLKNELDLLINNMNNVLGTEGGQEFNEQANRNLKRVQERLKSMPDYEEIDRKLKSTSLSVINSLFDFYNKYKKLDPKNPYYLQRKSLDALNFSNIFYQVKTIKLAINYIMEEMHNTGVDGKLATALASLQDKFTEAIKSQANYVLFVEDTYRRMVMEDETPDMMLESGDDRAERAKLASDANADTQKHIATNSAFFISTSTKDVIKQVRNVESIKPIKNDNPSPLTDPGNKPELMKELEVVLDEEEEYLNDYAGILEII